MDKIFTTFNSSLPWLKDGTIFLTKHGSHAYGTNTPISDLDVKGIAIPTVKYFLGFAERFEQAQTKDPHDLVIYDIRKFFNLAADCNPNIIEVLWTDPVDHLICTPLGEDLLKFKKAFLSKKAKFTFSGYAVSQLKRIQTHYRWLRGNVPKGPPDRKTMGLPEEDIVSKSKLNAAEAAIRDKINSWIADFGELDNDLKIYLTEKISSYLEDLEAHFGEDKYKAAARSIGFDDKLIARLDLERQYRNRQREWEQFQNWKKTRNPARAALEEKYGYDTKHGMHLVRLMRMCREILTTGKVIVKRPDAEELLSIRNGAWTYEQLLEWAKREDEELMEVYKTTNILPHTPNKKVLDELCIALIQKYWNG